MFSPRTSIERWVALGSDALLAALPIAVAIALPLLTAVTGLRTDAAILGGRAAELDAAVRAAEAKIHELRGTPFAALANGADAVDLAGGRRLERRWEVRDATPAPGLRTVRVAIDGLRDGAPPVEVSFVIAERRR